MNSGGLLPIPMDNNQNNNIPVGIPVSSGYPSYGNFNYEEYKQYNPINTSSSTSQYPSFA